MEYNIEFSNSDFQLLVRNSLISKLLLESDGGIDVEVLKTFTISQLVDQICFIKALRKFEGLQNE